MAGQSAASKCVSRLDSAAYNMAGQSAASEWVSTLDSASLQHGWTICSLQMCI